MAITATLITIAGTAFSGLKEYTVEYNKLWKEADRNMNGDVRATLIGIFPKIVAKTNTMTQDEVEVLCAKLDEPYFSVTFYDPRSGTTKTANYYASDYKTKLIERDRELYGEVDFSLVPLSKRSS